MNSDLEKLIEYAIIDGYITDKEKKVLFKKAAKKGFDTDELEMILEGKLAEKRQSQEGDKPKLEKCPSCGDIMNGLSRVCPSCDYVLYSDSNEDIVTLNEMMQKLDDSVYALKSIPDTTNSHIRNAVLKIIFTGGLYLLYKKVIKKEKLFEGYTIFQEKITRNIERQVDEIKNKYGEDEKTSEYLNEVFIETSAIIKKRDSSNLRIAIFTFLISTIIIFLVIYLFNSTSKNKSSATDSESSANDSIHMTESEKIANFFKGKEGPETKLKKLIDKKEISEAKTMLKLIENEKSKEDYENQIREIEVDSLISAKNYDAALELANFIKNSSYGNQRENKIDEIVDKQVNLLISQKKFKKARDRAEMCSVMKKYELIDRIELAENLNKK